MKMLLPAALLACILLAQSPPEPKARFAEHTIATGLTGGYHLTVADLNHDGKPDIIALASGLTDLVWFENPGWERHIIATGQARMINCAYVDEGAKADSEIVLAREFSNQPKKSLGVVSVLRQNGDPREPWTETEIDRIPATHRLRLANIDGNGRPVVINSALAAADAEPPDYRGEAPLVYYKPGEWKRHEILPSNQGLVHGIYAFDWDGFGRDSILTAGFEGIHLFQLQKNGQWTRTELSKGDPAPWPKSGSSDIAVGKLGRERFLAAIEPWHGNEVAIYRLEGRSWQRNVIDSSMVEGHTILTADLDGDGNDEVIAGYRGKGRSVNIYRSNSGGWSKEVLDAGGMAASSCAAVDLNGDRKPDLVCIGSATANLKWYENVR
jgi:hypothetical protein